MRTTLCPFLAFLGLLLASACLGQAIDYSPGVTYPDPIAGSETLAITYGPADPAATQSGAITGGSADVLTVTAPGNGTLNLRGVNSGYLGSVQLHGGTLNVGTRENLFGQLSGLIFESAATAGAPAGIQVEANAAIVVDGGGGQSQRMAIASDKGGRFQVLDGGSLSFTNAASSSSGGVFNLSPRARLDLETGAGASLGFVGNSTRQTGGAVYNYGGSFSHSGGSYVGNSAGNGGGAIYSNGGVLVLDSVEFDGNSNGWGSGGAIYSSSVGNYAASLTVNNARFANNVTPDQGGAIYNRGPNLNQNTPLTGSNLTFDNNRSTSGNGGAISNSFGITTLNNAQFSNNYAYQTGGAIYNNHVVDISNGTFTGNSSRNHGGAIYNYYNSTSGNVALTLTGSVFANNRTTGSGRGGAIYIQEGSLSLTDTSFTGNRSGWNGGAVFQWNGNTTLTVSANTTSVYSGNTDSGGQNAFHIQADAGKTATLAIDVGAGATLDMQDPMAGSAGSFSASGNITITKTGAGAWNLGGSSAFTTGSTPGTTTVSVLDGSLYLYRAGEKAGVGSGSLGLAGAGSRIVVGSGAGAVTLTAAGDNTLDAAGGVVFNDNVLVRGGQGSSGSARLTVTNAILNGNTTFSNGDSPILVLRGTFTGDAGSSFSKIDGGQVLVTSTGNRVGSLDVRDGSLGLVVGGEPNFLADSVSFAPGTRLDVAGFSGGAQGESVVLITSGADIAAVPAFSIGGETSADYLSGSVELSPDRRSILATVALSWYNQASDPAGQYTSAHGTFTVAPGSAFELGTVLADRTGTFASGWDGASLTKAGDGILALVAENTYSGTTTIRNGVLAITNLAATGVNATDKTVDLHGLGTLSLDIPQANSGEYRKTLVGTGRLVKENDGIVSLTGDNAGFSGNVVINGGALVATDSLSFGTGLVSNNALAELRFDGEFANTIAGDGILSAIGDIVLTGNQRNFTGTTLVGPGSVSLGGAGFISDAAFIVQEGGALSGTGQIGSLAVRNGGTLALGGGLGGIGVARDALFADGSRYAVTVDALAPGGVPLTVGGLTTIEAGAELGPRIMNVARAGAGDLRYQLIAANGGFADATLFDFGQAQRVGYTLSQEMTPDGLYLVISMNEPEFGSLWSSVATPNAQRAADAIDSLAAAGLAPDLGTLYDALAGLPADQYAVADALAQLHGEVFASGQVAALTTQRQFVRWSRAARENTIAAVNACRPRPTGRRAISLWGGVSGAWQNRGEISRYSGYSLRSTGVALGVDHMPDDRFFAGVAFGYDSARQRFKAIDSRADIEAFRAMAYGGFRPGDWLMDMYAGYAKNWHKTRRDIAISGAGPAFTATPRARYNDDMIFAGFELARAFALCPTTLTPSIGLDFAHLRTPGIRERNGGEASLAVDKRRLTSVQVPIGLRVARDFTLGAIDFRPEAGIFYVPELGSTRAEATTRFAAAPGAAFKTKSGDIGRHAGRLGLGVEAKIHDNVSLRLEYNLEVARKTIGNDVAFRLAVDW